jgi:hypothetical protein
LPSDDFYVFIEELLRERIAANIFSDMVEFSEFYLRNALHLELEAAASERGEGDPLSPFKVATHSRDSLRIVSKNQRENLYYSECVFTSYLLI